MITKGSYIKVVNGELAGQILLVKDITPSGEFLDCADTHDERHKINSNDVEIAIKQDIDKFKDDYSDGSFM